MELGRLFAADVVTVETVDRSLRVELKPRRPGGPRLGEGERSSAEWLLRDLTDLRSFARLGRWDTCPSRGPDERFSKTFSPSSKQPSLRLCCRRLREGQICRGYRAAICWLESSQARAFLARRGLKKGDRCALLAHNSIDWVALDLAIMAEGLIVVPLYARQAPAELVAMMKDCSPALICCGDAVTVAMRIAQKLWPEAPPQYLLMDDFRTPEADGANPRLSPSLRSRHHHLHVGTSGEAKGVVLTAGNVGHMLACTSGRLDSLDGEQARARPRVSLSAVLFRGFLDHAADLPCAR